MIKEYKYRIKLKLSNGDIRYVNANDQLVVETYAKTTNAKIIWVKEI
jgi:hypothetical protein